MLADKAAGRDGISLDELDAALDRIDAATGPVRGEQGLSDPVRHPGIDGSGMVKQAVDSKIITGVGGTFTMKMHNAEMGDYETTNHVVEYQRNRRIGWEPVLTAASRAEDQADIGDRSKHRWSYQLTPAGPGATLVTETYDCTQAPEWLRKAVKNGQRWVTSMTTTLENIDRQCTGS